MDSLFKYALNVVGFHSPASLNSLGLQSEILSKKNNLQHTMNIFVVRKKLVARFFLNGCCGNHRNS